MEGKEILRVEGVTKRFGSFTALNNITITVMGKDITSIIGPNGAGKTTLINVITGRLKPDSGKTYFMGRDITGMSPHRIVRLGIARTFQIINLFTTMTVYENILIASLSKKEGRKDVNETMEKLGLSSYKDVEVYKLPHGINRKVELAVALSTKPRLLILDEPLAGLTIGEKAELVELVKRISKETPIVLVEHDIDIVFDISKRIIVMHRGEVIADGSPSEVADNRRVREVYLGM